MSEKTKPLVSVVVPIYNAEKWLQQCIESICRQTYPRLEILLIDDGSADVSLAICKAMAEKDSRIRIIAKENSGVSETRNLGMQLATGKYLTFVDADDYLHPDILFRAVETMEKNAVQLCVWNAACVKGAEIIEESDIPEGRISRKNVVTTIVYDRCAEVPLGRYFRASWGKLYRMDTIRACGIWFPPQQKLGEDALFLLEYVKHIQYIEAMNQIGYYYRIINTSAVRRYREDLLQQNRGQLAAIRVQLEQFPEYEGQQLDTALTCLAWDMFRRLIRNNLLAEQYAVGSPKRKQEDAKVWFTENRAFLRNKNAVESAMPRTTRLQYMLSRWIPLELLCRISEQIEKRKL